LIVVLAINPILSVICALVKSLLYRSPIGENFNAIALLVAASDSDVSVLKDAEITGELRRKIRVSFMTVGAEKEDGISDQIAMSLDDPMGR
jgi:hypothetical protein